MADETEPATAPGKKRRKKSRAVATPATPARRPALDADGRERPRFLLAFPQDPELERLMAAFERGDFATVRAEAPLVAERAQDERVREAARELRRRIDPDPLVRYLLFASLALLVVLVLHAYTHKP